MKSIRLDQILHSLGYTSDEQIKRALIHQKQHGGRLGSNLLEMKYITEQQLAQALSIQYDVKAYLPPAGNSTPPKDILEMITAEFAERHLVIPIQYDAEKRSLMIVIADPEDEKTISEIGRTCDCDNVSVSIAPESIIERLIADWYRKSSGNKAESEMIELPDLFEESPVEPAGTAHDVNVDASDDDRVKNVLMISDAIFLRNFLTPIFEREGLRLLMHSEENEVLGALSSGSIDHVLVSRDMSEKFDTWIRRDQGPEFTPEVSIFSTVSGTLLENLVPYSISVSTIIKVLHIAAEVRSAACDPPPPYDLICRDVQALARDAGLKQLASDGMQMASLLLVPAGSGPVPFADTDRSIEYARTLRFPWDIEGTLQATLDLISGRKNPEDADTSDREVMLGAQIVALVWYRHTAFRSTEGKRQKAMSRVKTGLRKAAGWIARSDVIEAYVRHIEQSDDSFQSTPYQQIFIVGDVDSVIDQFATRMKHLGYRLVRIYDIDEASRMSERLLPTAVLIDEKSYPEESSRCRKTFGDDAPVLLFAVTTDGNPSHILDLFDAGFDEVFAPPYDFDIIAARIAKTIKNRTASSSKPVKPGGFSAEFKAFSFIDLVQALSQSRKSVHIELTRSSGERADIYMDNGRPVFAQCGDLTGADAIYHIITWQDDGSFVVEPEDHFQETNITVSIEATLMEGCRLFDEINS